MRREDLQVVLKAKELTTYTLRITSKADVFPKKFRHSLVDRMQNKCMDILTLLYEANAISNKGYKCEKISQAIIYCDEIDMLIEISLELNILGVDKVAHWSKLVSDVKHMAIAWRTEERK